MHNRQSIRSDGAIRSAAVVIIAIVLSFQTGTALTFPYKILTFEDIKPSGFVLSTCWEAIGVDPDDNVYVVFGDGGKTPGANGLENCAVFRYNANSGERKLLGTLRDVAKADNNLAPVGSWSGTESIPKGHAHLPYMNGKLYIGTQPAHELSGTDVSSKTYRGSHLFAVDTKTGTMNDFSATLPNGVVQQYQGLIDVATLPGKNLIFGFSHPLGQIVILDLSVSPTKITVGGGASGQVNRDMIVTNEGKVYFSMAFGTNTWYRYDMVTGQTSKMPFTTSWGFLNSRTSKKDNSMMFVATYTAVYKFDPRSEQMSKICDINGGSQSNELWSICLSIDETKLYAFTASPSNVLYEVDLASSKVTGQMSFSSIMDKCAITGSDARDSKGRLFFAGHNYGSKPAKLIQVDVGGNPVSVVGPTTRRGVASGVAVGAGNRSESWTVTGQRVGDARSHVRGVHLVTDRGRSVYRRVAVRD